MPRHNNLLSWATVEKNFLNIIKILFQETSIKHIILFLYNNFLPLVASPLQVSTTHLCDSVIPALTSYLHSSSLFPNINKAK